MDRPRFDSLKKYKKEKKTMNFKRIDLTAWYLFTCYILIILRVLTRSNPKKSELLLLINQEITTVLLFRYQATRRPPTIA